MSNTQSAVVLRDTRDVARLKWQLPVLLSMIAGAVDVIGFLSLGLFTAHVTGNIVIIAAHLVHGGPPNVPQIVAVPVFILAVAAVWFIAKLVKSQDAAWGRPRLRVQFALLTCVLILSVVQRPALDRKGLIADVTAITFSTPLIIVALAGLLLGERVRGYRWSAVILGLVGVLVILAPSAAATPQCWISGLSFEARSAAPVMPRDSSQLPSIW